mmetsp:Transcript_137549/g.325779  ORF Transcript_137549/g.325779 Transcript_137549/m.325779 type:complete len:456 (+) Transcript_137549:404-1771(+)
MRVHEAIGIVLAVGRRQHFCRHATTATSDHPCRLLQISTSVCAFVEDLLLVLMAADDKVDPRFAGNGLPIQGIGATAGGVAWRMVHHHNLPARVRFFNSIGEPLLLFAPELIEPLGAIRGVGRPRSCAATRVGALFWREPVLLAVLEFVRVSPVGAKVVVWIVRRVLRVEDIRVQEPDIRVECLELNTPVPILSWHDPASTILEGVEDLLVPALDVADTTIVVVAEDAPPFHVAQVLHFVHVLEDLPELPGQEGIRWGVDAVAVRIDSTGIEVVTYVEHEPGRRALLLQLLGLHLHLARDKGLRIVIDRVLKRHAVAVGHRNHRSTMPLAHASPVTDGEEVGLRVVEANRRPADSVVFHGVVGHARLWIRCRQGGAAELAGLVLQSVRGRAVLTFCLAIRTTGPVALRAMCPLEIRRACDRSCWSYCCGRCGRRRLRLRGSSCSFISIFFSAIFT